MFSEYMPGMQHNTANVMLWEGGWNSLKEEIINRSNA
jgi:hypothetical protein